MISPFSLPLNIPNEFITKEYGPSLFLKREDLLHPEVSGNKFRKLKYNIEEAKRQGKQCLLTFGGAFSNHIAATAAAGRLYGFKTVGVIRGEELEADLERTLQGNHTLRTAHAAGMQLKFVSRSDYREKEGERMLQKLKKEFGDFYLLPEGGSNALAVKGCEEILTPDDKEFDVVCCAVGTGGTISGVINSAAPSQQVLGFSALKGDFLSSEIRKHTSRENWELVTQYHFGGYAKVDPELIHFINGFKERHGTALDPIYTGKMLFGIFDLMQQGRFPENTRILAIHTGGLQGIAGMNQRLKQKKYPIIDV